MLPSCVTNRRPSAVFRGAVTEFRRPNSDHADRDLTSRAQAPFGRRSSNRFSDSVVK